MMTQQFIGAKLLLCLPKLKNYGLFLVLCMIFALTTAFSSTEFSKDNHPTVFEELTIEGKRTAAMMTQIIRIPTANIVDTVMITDCGEQVSFESDSTANLQYVDASPRNNVTVICPSDSSRFLRASFSNFDLAIGDTLFAFDGKDTTALLLGSGSGVGNFQFNGGWVGSNCDKTVNSSGCLTFQFKTNGDDAKGSGWEAWITCETGNVTITPPTNQFLSLDCDDYKTPVTITAASTGAACGLSNDSLLIQIYNAKGNLCKDTCIRADSSFVIDTLAIGHYTVQHTLKTTPTVTTKSYVVISPPALSCNDEVEAVLGSACLADIRPDYILEAPCDTSATLYYDIVLRTEGGTIIKTGTSRGAQYPVVTKDDVELCGDTKYVVEITRVYDYKGGCCADDLIKDVCWGYINFVDGTKPEFMTHSVDTLMACGTINFAAIGSSLTKPTILDNCDSITLTAIDNELIIGDECADMRTYLVTWEAADQCGNTARQIDTLRVIRPKLELAIKLPDVILSCGEDNPETMEDYDRLGIVKIPMPGDTITLSTDEYVCNYILVKTDEEVPHPGGKKIARYWAVIDGCGAIPFPIMVDTQLIEFIDTLAPTINCSPYGSLATAQPFTLPPFECTGRVNLTTPTVSDICAEPTVTMYTVEQLRNGAWVKIADNLQEAGDLECDTFRVGWEAMDVSLEENALRDSCLQYFRLEDRTPPRAICGDEIQITYDSDGTRLFASEIDHQSEDACGITKVEIRKEGGPWSEYLDFVCTDVHKTFFAELRFTDKGGNTNICGFNVILLDVIPPYCADLPDFTGTCDNFHNDQFGVSTDVNENYSLDDTEWVDLTDDLLVEYNNQFGNPVCEDNLACVPFTTDQQYQIVYAQCGVIKGRRRYRITDWNGQGLSSEWKYQDINISYTPGWTFTLPVDFFGECGDQVPDANITIENGACDLVGWEHEDQVFDLVPDACYKVIRTYHIINWCNYVQGQEPIELNRTENALGLVNTARTISYEDVSNYGYYTYIQVLKVTDNVAPTLSINEVSTCIYGVGDADPAGVEDITPGAAPYECDTVRTFSVEASDCEQNAFKNFSFTYEIYEDSILVGTGEGNKFFWVVRPKVAYTVRFTVYDNCGNEGSLTKDYEFWDCSRPSVVCIPEIAVEITQDSTARVDAIQFDKGSWDNCTPQSRLTYKIWHESLSLVPPNDKAGVASLPSTIYLDCDYRGTQPIYYYVLDEENNYDFCVTTVIVTNSGGICVGDPASVQAIVAGNIHTTAGTMVEAVNITIDGVGDMPNTQTTTGGDFSLNLTKGAAYEVIPVKQDAPLNGVTTFDLIVISKHILGIQTFTSPYEHIAADVNKSGTVTAFDLVQLRQLILNIIPDFPTNNSWRFVDAKYDFTTTAPLQEEFNEAIEINNHQADMMDADFVAIKIGDLNGSATTNNLQQSEARTNSNKLTFKWTDKALEAGETITLDFNVADLQTLEGYQLALDFTGLTLMNIQEGLVKRHHFGQALLNRNILISSWDKLSSPTESTTTHTHLFSLELKAHTAGNLSEFLHLQPKIIPTEAYKATGEILDIALDFETTNTGFTLEQNRPNPFKEQTTIGFQLPHAGKVTLTILDVQGRVLLQDAKDFSAGNQQWLIEGQALTTKGILYYQLATDNELLTKKMMMLE